MKKETKISVWTIILIILSLYLLVQTILWYDIRERKWDSCEEKEPSKGTPLTWDKNYTVLYNYNSEREWDSWMSCLGDYSDSLMMFNIFRIFTIFSIGLAVISWRIDLKKKA